MKTLRTHIIRSKSVARHTDPAARPKMIEQWPYTNFERQNQKGRKMYEQLQ